MLIAAAILTVIVVWLVQYFAWTRPRDPNVIDALAASKTAWLQNAVNCL